MFFLTVYDVFFSFSDSNDIFTYVPDGPAGLDFGIGYIVSGDDVPIALSGENIIYIIILPVIPVMYYFL